MKKFLIVFITICISALAVPFAVMAFRPTTESTDNRKLAEFPRVASADGAVNTNFFSGFENWFSDHFAFRNELIYSDAKIQNDVFKVSNVENVISGKDGWLFYTSTLNDYLGTERLSDREIYNIAHNLSLANEYIKEKDSAFVLTIPANKNTLYGEYMPYYDSYIVNNIHDVEKLVPLLESMQVPYADLVKKFKDEDEILYLKTDSHWNNKGAILAYNTIMDTLGLAHDEYSDVEVTKTAENGDLSKMMYTFYGQKEENYVYDINRNYEYEGNFTSVEDGRIKTVGSGGNGQLLMFRDSFGNTLIPIIANQFAGSRFSRENAYSLEKQMEESTPDVVIFEKVERNIKEFMTMPPVISAPVYAWDVASGSSDNTLQSEESAKINIKSLELDFDYYEISGEIDQNLLNIETNILVNVNGTTYKAYHTGEGGFAIYLKKDNVTFPAVVKVFITDESTGTVEIQTFNIDDAE